VTITAADACPGIVDLHEARDGHVARIRLPGGYASATALAALAAMAARFGDGHVDLTARGNVQLRGIRAAEAGELAQRAAAAGFLPSPAHDRARNITASPLAGLGGRPALRGLVRSLDRAIRADPGLASLPGRFVFCLDDGTGRAGLSTCDVGLRRRGQGFDVVVAGRQTGQHGPAAEGIGCVVAAARAFLGQRPTTTVDAEPTAPASAASAGPRPASTPAAGARPASNRVAGLPDGGAGVAAAIGGVLGERVADTTARLPLGPVADAAPPADAAVPMGAATLAVVAAPLARLTVPQLLLIAALVRPGEVARLAAAGRIVLPLTGRAGAVLPQLAGAGLLVADDHPLSGVTACSGTACASSLADVRSLAGPVPGLAAVHWAGCSRRCGLPADATAVVASSASQFTVADGAVSGGTGADGTARRVLTVVPG
jgi:precorrin-3B synthase